MGDVIVLINRNKLNQIDALIDQLSKKRFDIHIQYKFIKIRKAIKEEEEIYQEQIKLNCEPYFEKDQFGNPIMNEQGGFKISSEKINECYLLMHQMNSLDIQIPDIYFSLDELEKLDLTLGELSLLEPFIK